MLKLIDFGEAFSKTAVGMNNVGRGITYPYAAPEQIDGNRNGTNTHFDRSDIHSVGVIILSLFFDLNTTDMKYLGKSAWQSRPWTKYYSMCAERSKYFGSQEHMLVLLEVAYKCIKNDSLERPTLEWLTVIVRRLFYSLQG